MPKSIENSYDVPLQNKIPAPFLEIVVSDPSGRKRVILSPMVDTGYDGALLLPLDTYNELSLYAYQYPDGEVVGETVTGEKIDLLSAEAKIEISGLDFQTLAVVDAF